MKSAREQKLKTFISTNLNAYDCSNNKAKKSNLRSDRSPAQGPLSNRKRKSQLTIMKIQRKVITFNLNRHNTDEEKYFAKVTNDIIYDERKHLVCIFKDYLLWDESSDFLKRYYFSFESTARIPNISAYYEKYTVMKPVYFKLTCQKIMQKNIRRHRKYLEIMEENEEKLANRGEEIHEPSDYSKLIKTNLMEESKKIIEDDCQTQKKTSDLQDQSYSVIFSDNLNISNNFSLYSQFNKFISPNEEDNFLNSREIREKRELTMTSIKKETTKKEDREKVTLICPKRDITDSDGKTDKIFKKIEFNKLDLRNINNLNEMDSTLRPSINQNTLNKLEIRAGEDIQITNRFTSSTTRNKPTLNPIINAKGIGIVTRQQPVVVNAIGMSRIPAALSKKNSDKAVLNDAINAHSSIPSALQNTNLNTLNIKNMMSTNDIKKRLNLVENVVKKLKDNQTNQKANDNKVIDNKMKFKNNFIISNTTREKERDLLTKDKTTRVNVLSNRDKGENCNLISIPKNSVIKSSNIMLEKEKELLHKNSSKNLTTHLKANSQKNELTSGQNSIYNINLNLNLNVNLNMLQKKKATPSHNSSKIVTRDNIDKYGALTERPSVMNSNTVTSSKLDKLGDKTDRVSIANVKANDKYKKMSRNNVKNFILNYGSNNINPGNNGLVQHPQNKKSKNLVINIKESNSNNQKEMIRTNSINNSNFNNSKNLGALTLTPNGKSNNNNPYYKKYISNTNTNSTDLSTSQKKILPKNFLINGSIPNGNLVIPNSTVNSQSGLHSLTNTNNTFNQRNLNREELVNKAVAAYKKPLSISLKKNQIDKIRDIVNKYPLTSRSKKDSIKIFNI